MSLSRTTKRIGEILVERGLIILADIERGLDAQKRSGLLLGEQLLDLGLLSADDLLDALSEQFQPAVHGPD